jgi:hypothetical protein
MELRKLETEARSINENNNSLMRRVSAQKENPPKRIFSARVQIAPRTLPSGEGIAATDNVFALAFLPIKEAGSLGSAETKSNTGKTIGPLLNPSENAGGVLESVAFHRDAITRANAGFASLSALLGARYFCFDESLSLIAC